MITIVLTHLNTDIQAVVMSFVMCVVGMVTLVTLAVPLIFLLLITYLITVLHFDSINLKNYGLFTTDYVIQGLELDEFYSKVGTLHITNHSIKIISVN